MFLQILLDHNQDKEGNSLPKLVYMAREKRPDHFHNFKAGAMNALVSNYFYSFVFYFMGAMKKQK